MAKTKNGSGSASASASVNPGSIVGAMQNFMNYAHNHISALNQSKIFAGVMIVVINIASKFVTINMSKTMESYLKYTFSRDILVFAITWMGTRDIYVAIGLTLLFILLVDYLFNEESYFCCLPESFTSYHVDKLEGMDNRLPTADEIAKAKIVLEKANMQNSTNSGLPSSHMHM